MSNPGHESDPSPSSSHRSIGLDRPFLQSPGASWELDVSSLTDASPVLVLDVTIDAGTATIAVTGELDHGTCDVLHRLQRSVLAIGVHSIVFDCAATTFMDCGGLHCIEEALDYAQRRGGTVTVQQPPPSAQWLLAITGLGSQIMMD